MNYFISLFAIVLFATGAFAQCNPPEDFGWEASGDSNFTINFNAPASATGYQLNIYGEYGDLSAIGEMDTEGDTQEGANSVDVDVSTFVEEPVIDLATYYFTAELRLVCANGDLSAPRKFYLSQASLLGDEEYNLGDLIYHPIENVDENSDNNDVFESNFTVTPDQVPNQGVSDISVFLDGAGTGISNFSIELINPAGTTVQLTHDSAFYSPFSAYSILFQDGSPNLGILGSEEDLALGTYSSIQPLAPLADEPIAGEWTIRISHLFDNTQAGMLFGMGLVFNANPCDIILAGTVFYDFNNNGVQDSNEYYYYNAMIENSINEETVNIDILSGTFNICSPAGTGALSLMNIPQYYDAPDINLDLETGDSETGLLFPLSPIPGIQDLEVELSNWQSDVPGFGSTYRIRYQNIGTECIDDVTLTVEFDESIEVLNAAEGTISGQTVTFNPGAVCATGIDPYNYQSYYYDIGVMIPDTVSVGSVLSSTVTGSPIQSDEDAANNTFTANSEVVSSFDPNDIQVNTGIFGPEFLTNENPLIYTIRFQNTGNYYAQRVVITDMMDENLNPSSFRVISSSDPVQVSWQGDKAFFEFDDIYLPDSATDMEGSKGYVKYEINPDAAISDGTTMTNHAAIYFDFNEPVLTNEVNTLFDISLGLEEYNYRPRLYPNPAKSHLNVEWTEDATINGFIITDIQGRVVKISDADNGARRMNLDIKNLPAGTYLLKAESNKKVRPVVWVKQ